MGKTDSERREEPPCRGEWGLCAQTRRRSDDPQSLPDQVNNVSSVVSMSTSTPTKSDRLRRTESSTRPQRTEGRRGDPVRKSAGNRCRGRAPNKLLVRRGPVHSNEKTRPFQPPGGSGVCESLRGSLSFTDGPPGGPSSVHCGVTRL